MNIPFFDKGDPLKILNHKHSVGLSPLHKVFTFIHTHSNKGMVISFDDQKCNHPKFVTIAHDQKNTPYYPAKIRYNN